MSILRSFFKHFHFFRGHNHYTFFYPDDSVQMADSDQMVDFLREISGEEEIMDSESEEDSDSLSVESGESFSSDIL